MQILTLVFDSLVADPDRILNILGQCATWFTVGLVFLTLKEMERQRRHSYRPEIVILNAPVQFGGRESIPQFGEHASAQIVNLGVGAALDIQFEWEMDVQNLIHEIDDHPNKENLPFQIRFTYDTEPLSGFIGFHLGEDQIFVSLQSDLEGHHDYLMPATTAPEGLRVQVPTTYLIFLHLRSILLGLRPNEIKGLDHPWQEADLRLRYKDLSGRVNEKRWKARFHLTELEMQVEEPLSIKANGMLEFNEERDNILGRLNAIQGTKSHLSLKRWIHKFRTKNIPKLRTK